MNKQLEQNKNVGTVEDPYRKFQKSAQIVRVEGRDSQVAINLAGIIPNFNQNQLISQANKIYYQLRSFRTKNMFSNLKRTDSLSLYIKMGIAGAFALFHQDPRTM